MKQYKYIVYLFIFITGTIFAQSVRSLNNNGVDKYENKDYSDAEVDFKKAVEENAETFASQFNLGSALYKQERYDEAIKNYQSALALAENNQQKAQVYYNQGNALLKGKKLQESVDAYKEALKINPNDLEAKYNLSYALEMMKNQNQKNQNQKNQNKNQDQKNKDKQQNKDQKQNQDQNKDQNKDQDKKDQQQNQQNKDKQNQDQQNQQQQQQPKKDQISKEEAKRILAALKNNEAEIQKELRKKKGAPTKSAKDW